MLSSQRQQESRYPELSGWIALDYFRRRRPLGRARGWVTATAVVLTAAYAGWTMLPDNHTAHQSGPLSPAHTLFGADCAQCHREPFQPLARLVSTGAVPSVTDATCSACHRGSHHHQNQEHASTCAACHAEHRGKASLSHVADGHCTACHARLAENQPGTHFANVSSFATDHPEFAAAAPRPAGTVNFNFNHAAHLNVDLRTLAARGVPAAAGLGERLDCTACHEPDAERRYMQPVRYEKHCAKCHFLTVRIGGELTDRIARQAAEAFRKVPAPHRPSEEVRALLRERLLDFVRTNPVIPKSGAATLPRPIPGSYASPVSEAEGQWVRGQLGMAEEVLFVNRQLPNLARGLFDVSCRACHVPAESPVGAAGLPTYRPTGFSQRRFAHSVFRHDRHRMLTCTACHADAAGSVNVATIAMPGIATCRQCHTGHDNSARSDCATCHTYHDHRQDRSLNGTLTIGGGKGVE